MLWWTCRRVLSRCWFWLAAWSAMEIVDWGNWDAGKRSGQWIRGSQESERAAKGTDFGWRAEGLAASGAVLLPLGVAREPAERGARMGIARSLKIRLFGCWAAGSGARLKKQEFREISNSLSRFANFSFL